MRSTMPAMTLAAQEWHYWLAPAVMIATLLLILALLVGYLVKVVGPRVPRR